MVTVPNSRFEKGCIIGDFLIQGKIGAGAGGLVYLAWQLSLERQVALKVLPKSKNDSDSGSTFLKEARSVANLSHQNLVQVYAVGEEDGYSYMAMNYIRGETLKSRLKRERRIPADEALHIIQQIAEALHYAWMTAKLIHRDIKPANIILAEDGTAKLTDLGLAMTMDDWHKDMDISGSPPYMSPEQFQRKPLDTRSDIYSLGVTLYEMITGQLPFRATAVPIIAHQHVFEKPESPGKIVKGLKQSVSSLILKMLSKSPDKRFDDMESLIRTIRRVRLGIAPNPDYVPNVHTISISKLNYAHQREYAAEVLKKERAARKEASRKDSLYLRIMFIVIPTVIIVMVLLFLIFDNLRVRKHTIRQNEYDAFERLCSNPEIPYEKLEEESKRLLEQLEHDKGQEKRYKHYITYYIRYLLQKRLPTKPIAKIAGDFSDVQNNLQGMEADIKMLKTENQMLRTEIIPSLRVLNDEYLLQIDVLRRDIISAENQQKKEQAKFDQQKREWERIQSEIIENIKNHIRVRAYQLVITQRFSGAKQLLKSETTTHPEIEEWSVELFERIELLEKVNSVLEKVKGDDNSLGNISYKQAIDAYREDYPESKAIDNDIIGAFELLCGSLKNASKYLPNQPEINATADAVAEDLLSAVRTLHVSGVTVIPKDLLRSLDSLPETPRVSRIINDIRQILPAGNDSITP